MQDIPGLRVTLVQSFPLRNGQGTRYVVTLSNGMAPSTFDGGLATIAGNAFNAGATVTARVVQTPPNANGKSYLNLEGLALDGQALPGGGLPAAQGQAPAGQIPGVVPGGQQGGGGGGGGAQYQRPMDPATTQRVTYLSTLATAAAVVGQLYAGAGDGVSADTLALKLDELASKLARRALSLSDQGQPAQAPAAAAAQPLQPVATDAQGVAAFANAQIPGAVQLGAPAVPQGAPQVAAPPVAPAEEQQTAQQSTLPGWL